MIDNEVRFFLRPNYFLRSDPVDNPALRGLEHELICGELKKTGGNMAEASRNLGITERVMGLRVKDHQINVKRFRRAKSRA